MKTEDIERLKKICEKEGFIIDGFNDISVVLTKKQNQLPKNWNDLECVSGWIGLMETKISRAHYSKNTGRFINYFKLEREAQASLELAKLTHLRHIYRNGWEPDWADAKPKWCIAMWDNVLDIKCESNKHFFLAFEYKETAKLFLNNFKDLIEESSPLLFG
jgi:hypothetical protein